MKADYYTWMLDRSSGMVSIYAMPRKGHGINNNAPSRVLPNLKSALEFMAGGEISG